MDTPPPTEFENMTLLQVAEHYHGLVYKYNKSEGGTTETEELDAFKKLLRDGSPREQKLRKALKWQEQWLGDYFGDDDTDSGEPKKAMQQIRRALAATEMEKK